MNDICCYNKDTCKYSLDQSKIMKSVALSLLTMKNSFHLKEFISALKHAIDLALPIDLQQLNMTEDSSFDPCLNLFEHYKDYDLSFLKGYAIIIP